MHPTSTRANASSARNELTPLRISFENAAKDQTQHRLGSIRRTPARPVLLLERFPLLLCEQLAHLQRLSRTHRREVLVKPHRGRCAADLDA
jgi:hypothetical protein